MFGIGAQEMMIIGLLCLVLFGPGKLPGMARDLGSSARKARAAAEEFRSELNFGEDRGPRPAFAREPGFEGPRGGYGEAGVPSGGDESEEFRRGFDEGVRSAILPEGRVPSPSGQGESEEFHRGFDEGRAFAKGMGSKLERDREPGGPQASGRDERPEETDKSYGGNREPMGDRGLE